MFIWVGDTDDFHFVISKRADFEYARLLACQGDKDGARAHLEMVLSGELSSHPIPSHERTLTHTGCYASDRREAT